ncbi:tRNA 2-selenouridine(34) synthase MnmH [Tepidibacillus fermentans]|uniref:tRNA 2-selenouridine synthase n=1 Tax=Tepidibacillus fermentans TaxID=1281767 RepID=A0A4V2UT17_9BACI|nr:tRNA 2-selenouridine(34) synthase MnmH [Tepidibacillus fermentans]TCS83684.1 tRNA 2-selenouridine synthase [Tepidibacillus fermentans]
MFTDVKYKEIENDPKYLLIDVRSEGEFVEASIPGAINIPLFNNEERAKVGTVYKQKGPNYARELGLEIVSPKIPSLMKQVRESLKERQYPLFFCWRGGMRSKSMATFYGLVYEGSYRLEGGYRSYREYILGRIPFMTIDVPTFVLHGMTGVGKTQLLYRLKERGFTILDLEGLAGHRGSAFGAIGINPVNQKMFDSKLYEALKEIQKADAVILEAESKRIGKIIIPDHIMDAKEKGQHILVHASIDTRISRILEDYQPEQYKESFVAAIDRIERKLPTDVRPLIRQSLEMNDFYTVAKLLLQHYYDPRYQYATDQYNGPFFEVYSDDLNNAVDSISQFILERINQLQTIS